jgi:hypothetical protein
LLSHADARSEGFRLVEAGHENGVKGLGFNRATLFKTGQTRSYKSGSKTIFQELSGFSARRLSETLWAVTPGKRASHSSNEE